MTALRTEFSFVLPRGYVDRTGTLHRRGTMRLATAMDEIAPLRDPRVRQNHAYLTVILLSRVVTQLGTMPMVDTSVIEEMFTSDIAFLQELYRRKNTPPEPHLGEGHVACPACGEEFVPPQPEPEDLGEPVLAGRLGGIARYPLDRLHEEVAFLSYYLHWPLDQVMELEHTERRLWATQVSAINKRLNDSDKEEPFKSWVPEAL